MRTSFKRDTLCPIVGLDIFEFLYKDYLILGLGPAVQIFSIETNVLIQEFLVFNSHCVDGIISNVKSEIVILFGNKDVRIFQLLQLNSHPFLELYKCFDELDDLIISCSSYDVPNTNCKLLFVGYAHNFIDVYDITESKKLVRFSSTSCVLFSLSFSFHDSGSIYISSGTAFGKIIIWNQNFESEYESCLVDVKPTFVLNGHEGVIFRMKWSKDGKFLASVSDDRTIRIWNTSIGTQLQVLWGHICRVWDVVFLDSNELHTLVTSNNSSIPDSSLDQTEKEAVIIASCGEDSCIKLWNKSGKCINTMFGHTGRNIWRIACTSDKKTIISTGNDANVHFWPLSLFSQTISGTIPTTNLLNILDGNSPGLIRSQTKTSIDSNKLIGSITAAIPDWPQAHDYGLDSLISFGNRSSSKRSNGVASIKISPSGTWLVIILLEGNLWIVRVGCPSPTVTQREHGSISKDPGGAGGSQGREDKGRDVLEWRAGMICRKPVTTADIVFDKEESEIYCFCAHHDSSVSLFSYSLTEDNSNPVPVPLSPRFISNWMAHELRTVNLWILTSVTAPRPFSSAARFLAITATVKGKCSLWSLELDECMRVTHHCIAKICCDGENIATSCLWMDSAVIASAHNRHLLILGDSKGGVSVFLFPRDVNIISSDYGNYKTKTHTEENDRLDIEKEHIDVKVASSHHDCHYTAVAEASDQTEWTGQPPPTPPAASVAYETDRSIPYSARTTNMSDDPKRNELQTSLWSKPHVHGKEPVNLLGIHTVGFYSTGHDGYICIFRINWTGSIQLISKLNCYPITTPEHVRVVGRGGKNMEIFVGGYQSNLFQIWELRNHTQIMNVEGGSWKRTHHSTIESHLSSHGSGFPSVSFACIAPSDDGGTEVHLHSTSLILPEEHIDIPLALGTTGHGKVCCSVGIFRTIQKSNSGTMRPSLFAVSGGEEGQVRCYSLLPRFHLEQFVCMPSSVPVRSVACSQWPGQNKGIVVAAGGRLSFGVWEIASDPQSDVETACAPHSSAIDSRQQLPDMNIYLDDLFTGTTWRKATQDHRILCASCIALDPSYRIREESESNTDSGLLEVKHVSLLSDSRGKAAIVNIAENDEQSESFQSSSSSPPSSSRTNNVSIVKEFLASEYPIISSGLVTVTSTITEETWRQITDAQRLLPSSQDSLSVEADAMTEGNGSPSCLNDSSDTDGAKEYQSGVSYGAIISVTGDTDGAAAIHQLSLFQLTHATGEGIIKCDQKELCTYRPHLMGCNAMTATTTAIIRTSDTLSLDEVSGGGKIRLATYELLVCTGGDDQAITVNRSCCEMYISSKINRKNYFGSSSLSSVSTAVTPIRITRVEECCGSAIKGICIQECMNIKFLLTVGYDARLSVWKISASNHPDQLPVESFYNKDVDVQVIRNSSPNNHVLKWVDGVICNIGDINGLTTMLDLNENNSSNSKLVAVVCGEGMQCIEFDVWKLEDGSN